MHRQSALTLFELLVVIALIGLISLPLYFSYTHSQANQSLRSSAEQLQHSLETAHVSAREAKDKRSWGVKNLDSKSFALISGKTSSYKTERVVSLENLVEFPNNFEVWFEIGSGQITQNTSIELKNSFGKSALVSISKTGIIDVKLNP